MLKRFAISSFVLFICVSLYTIQMMISASFIVVTEDTDVTDVALLEVVTFLVVVEETDVAYVDVVMFRQDIFALHWKI